MSDILRKFHVKDDYYEEINEDCASLREQEGDETLQVMQPTGFPHRVEKEDMEK